MSSTHTDRRALAVLIFGAVMIGVGPVFVRIAQASGVDPSASAFWRVTLALPILALIGASRRARGDAGAFQAPTLAAAAAGFLFAGDLVCWHYGLRLTTIAKATVLSNMTPVLVTPAAFLLHGDRPRPGFLVGMALAIGGSAAMALARSRTGLDPHLGDLVSAGAALWYAAYMLVVRSARQRLGAGPLLLWSSLVASPLLLAFALAGHERLLPQTAGGWGALCALGAMHVAGQGSIAWALGRLPAPVAAVVVLVQPVVAAVAAWIAFGEPVTATQAAFGALALAGVAYAQASRRAPAPAPSPAPAA